MFKRFIELVGKNKDLSPDFEIIPLTEKQNRFQYVGGQIENGMLYSVVNSAEKMLKYDIEQGTMCFGELSRKQISNGPVGAFMSVGSIPFPVWQTTCLYIIPIPMCLKKLIAG